MQLPKETLSNFVENSYGRIKSQFISAIERGKKRFIFSGAYGTGKTFLAKAFANDSGLDFKEINLYTLEYGDEDDVSKVFYSYITQEAVSTSLFYTKKEAALHNRHRETDEGEPVHTEKNKGHK
jgi:ATPase family associated with various cellular activities (AAA).